MKSLVQLVSKDHIFRSIVFNSISSNLIWYYFVFFVHDCCIHISRLVKFISIQILRSPRGTVLYFLCIPVAYILPDSSNFKVLMLTPNDLSITVWFNNLHYLNNQCSKKLKHWVSSFIPSNTMKIGFMKKVNLLSSSTKLSFYTTIAKEVKVM